MLPIGRISAGRRARSGKAGEQESPAVILIRWFGSGRLILCSWGLSQDLFRVGDRGARMVGSGGQRAEGKHKKKQKRFGAASCLRRCVS